MSVAQRALNAASGYLRRNPGEIARAVRNLVGLRAGLPVDALRWLMDQAAKGGKIEDPVITEVPPGLRVTASVDLMKTPVRASAVVYIDRVVLDPDQIRMVVRLEEIWVEVIGDATTPVAALLRSGALDLSKPGELAKYMDLPPVIVEARENKLTLDLRQPHRAPGPRGADAAGDDARHRVGRGSPQHRLPRAPPRHGHRRERPQDPPADARLPARPRVDPQLPVERRITPRGPVT
jgi:hypothetical protein